MRPGLDTSVVLRLLVGEPAAQAAAAWHALDAAPEPALLSDLVVSETYFALRHHYAVPHAEAVATLRALLSDRRVRATGIAAGVLDRMPDQESGPGLMDRLIAADYGRDGAKLLTFDRAAARLSGGRLLSA